MTQRRTQKPRNRQPVRRSRIVRTLPPVPGTTPYRIPNQRRPTGQRGKGRPEQPPRRRSQHAWLLAWLAVALLPAPKLLAGIPVIDSANLIENVRQALHTATQIEYQVEQLDTMYRNLERVADPNWRDLSGLFDELNDRAQQGESLAYSDRGVYGTFKSRLPGYVVMEPDQFEDVYKKWTEIAIDTFAATLDTASAQAREYESTQGQLAELAAIANGVGGNVQAEQASAMLEGHMAQEVARLNQLLAANLNAQTVYYGQLTTLRANHEATLQWLIEESKQPLHVYDGNSGLKPVPDGWPWGVV